MTRLRDTLKQSLTQVGALSPISVLSSIEMTLNYLWVGQWMREKGFNPRRVESREQIFDLVAQEIETLDVLYLEFGVFGGTSMQYWSKLLKHPKSKLHGFDSFEGLPEAWGRLTRDTSTREEQSQRSMTDAFHSSRDGSRTHCLNIP
jgi:hypothetical protein